MNTIVRSALFAVAATAAALGGFSAVSALTSRSDASTDETVEQRPDLELLLPATTGHEAAVFGSSVSALRHGPVVVNIGDATITLHSAQGGQICTDVELPLMHGSGCSFIADLRSGIMHGAYMGPDQVVHIVGLVPDDVANVTINGTTITVESNLWYYAAPQGTDLSFVVASSDGKKIARVG